MHWRRFLTLDGSHWLVHLALARALREQGALDQAEQLLLSAASRFPDNAIISVQYSLIAEMREDWSAALRRREAYSARFPDDWTGEGGRIRALRQMGQADAAARLIEAALPDQRDQGSLAAGADILRPEESRAALARFTSADVASRFESLGGGSGSEGAWSLGCEFAFFQRHAGIEPAGLLRWASIGPASLAAALEAGSPELTRRPT